MSKKTYIIELPSGKKITCDASKDLRSNLRDYFDEIYNQKLNFFNCKGFGTCGTCAMSIEGSVTAKTKIEKWRLSFPPHKDSDKKNLRLLCQCKALSNLKLKKLNGFWGNIK